MRFFAVAIAFASLVVSRAETITVNVGETGLTFTPNAVTAAVGDVVNFQFFPKNHTVTQSTFAAPCQKLATGVDSGYQPVTTADATIPVWSFTVENASAPLWFYCAQGTHCTAGMVFAINPTAEKSFDAFKATAMGATANASDSAVASASVTATGAAAGATGSNGAFTPSMNVASVLSIAGLLAGVLL